MYFVFGIFELNAKTIYIKQTLNLQCYEIISDNYRLLHATVHFTDWTRSGVAQNLGF